MQNELCNVAKTSANEVKASESALLSGQSVSNVCHLFVKIISQTY